MGEEGLVGLLELWRGLIPRGLWWGEVLSTPNVEKSKKAGGGNPANASDVAISGADQK